MIKELRNKTGLTQKEFAGQYHIPLQTLKQWESDSSSTSFRTPPEYVVFMLERLVNYDFDIHKNSNASHSYADYLIRAAAHSKYNARHWMRYLRKVLSDGKPKLSQEEINEVLNSDRLTMYQKVSFKQAMIPGTATNCAVAALDRRVQTTMVDEVKKRFEHV